MSKANHCHTHDLFVSIRNYINSYTLFSVKNQPLRLFWNSICLNLEIFDNIYLFTIFFILCTGTIVYSNYYQANFRVFYLLKIVSFFHYVILTSNSTVLVPYFNLKNCHKFLLKVLIWIHLFYIQCFIIVLLNWDIKLNIYSIFSM